MKKTLAVIVLALLFSACGGGGFKSAPAPVVTPKTFRAVVFMGDSLTQNWELNQYFPGKNYINKGIGGQATSAMLSRFDADVIDLHPDAVVIWGGTNSFEWYSDAEIETHLQTMYEKAKAANIDVIACTISPRRADGIDPHDYTPRILVVNAWIKSYASTHGIAVADYYPPLADSQGWLRVEMANDHVHLNALGYQAVAPILKALL